MDRLMLGLKVMHAPAPSLSLTPLSSSREVPSFDVPDRRNKAHTHTKSYNMPVQILQVNYYIMQLRRGDEY